jgi:hypothetical protein
MCASFPVVKDGLEGLALGIMAFGVVTLGLGRLPGEGVEEHSFESDRQEVLGFHMLDGCLLLGD